MEETHAWDCQDMLRQCGQNGGRGETGEYFGGFGYVLQVRVFVSASGAQEALASRILAGMIGLMEFFRVLREEGPSKERYRKCAGDVASDASRERIRVRSIRPCGDCSMTRETIFRVHEARYRPI